MKAPFSAYLTGIKPGLKQLLETLTRDYPYVSILATDSKGLAIRISQRSRSVGSETMTTERGIVVRAFKDGLYREYAFNEFDPANLEDTLTKIREAFKEQEAVLLTTGAEPYLTPCMKDSSTEATKLPQRLLP